MIIYRLVDSMFKSISPFISVYKNSYNTQPVMLKLLEEWRNLDKNYVIGGVLIDLSKAFDCVPHNLLLTKLAAYGVDESFLSFVRYYLLYRKQFVRINNINSDFLNIFLGVPYLTVFLITFFTLLKLLMPTNLQTIIYKLPSQIIFKI